MSDFTRGRRFAALPMYDWPEARHETDAEWQRVRAMFKHAGVDAPPDLVRRNGDMPAVPGGIRGVDGTVISPDPATLPPEELDLHALWLHPGLLFAQTCWGPMELGLAKHVQVVGQPSYEAYEGGQGEFYSSAIVMRSDALHSIALPYGLPAISPTRGEIAPSLPLWPNCDHSGLAPREMLPISPLVVGEMAGRPEGDTKAPADGKPDIPLDLFRGLRLAFNSVDSMSGIIALTRDLAAMNEPLDIFSERIETGGHRASIVAVAEGRTDVCAIDCRSWALALEHEPAAKAVRVVGWTGRRKGLPYITAASTPDDVVARLRAALAAPAQPARSFAASL